MTIRRRPWIVAEKREYRLTPPEREKGRIDGSSFPVHALIGGFRELDGYTEDILCSDLENAVENTNSCLRRSHSPISEHFLLTVHLKLDYPELWSRDDGEFFDWIAPVVADWVRRYIPRIRKVLANEYAHHKRVTPKFINHMVGLCRLRLLPIILSILTTQIPRESSVIAQVPRINEGYLLPPEELYDLVYLDWVKHLAVFPCSGPSAIGSTITVDIDGTEYKAFKDYMHIGNTPDYIIYNTFPGVFNVYINGDRYISYYHIETPYSKTSIPHFRLSKAKGSFFLMGVEIKLPTIAIPPIRYAASGGRTVLDAIICPPSVLEVIPHGDGFRALISDILDGRSDVCKNSDVSLESFIFNRLRVRTAPSSGNRYKISYETKGRISTLPPEYQSTYKEYTTV